MSLKLAITSIRKEVSENSFFKKEAKHSYKVVCHFNRNIYFGIFFAIFLISCKKKMDILSLIQV